MSAVLYTVRSRFTDPAREHEWNEWYAGHLERLLRVPGFRAAQRFHSYETADERPYLAMYEVAGAEVFHSDAYLSVWGFRDWRPLIDNWTRDIFELRHGPGIDFATGRDGSLRAAFLSGAEEAVDEALTDLSAERPALRGARVAGLDRSCEGIAWQPGADATHRLPEPAGVAVAQARYTPITECLS